MGARRATSIGVLVLAAAFASCGAPTGRGQWQGTDIHLVDGTWLDRESTCDDGNVECTTVVGLGLQTLPPDLRSRVVGARVAALPTSYKTVDGQIWNAHMGGGILEYRAMVVDLADGSRRVVGLLCHLPYRDRLIVRDATCAPAALDQWLDGHLPETPPPGQEFG
jgi:hypothetical protein